MVDIPDARLNAAIEANLHLLDDKARKALTFTRWKDGIDCDYLTIECRGFVAGILLHLAADGVRVGSNPQSLRSREAGQLAWDALADGVKPSRALPHPGSPEASAMLDSMLAEYQYPANPKNAARAGWEAANRWLTSGVTVPVSRASDGGPPNDP